MITAGLIVATWILFFFRGFLGVPMPVSLTDPHLLTAGLTSIDWSGQIMATIALIVFGYPAERVLGSRRYAITAAVTYLLSLPLGAIVAEWVAHSGLNHWGADILSQRLLSPVPWILGTTAFATAWMRPLWRGRYRLVLGVLMASLVLFAGTLLDVVSLVGVVLGVTVGYFHAGGSPKPHKVRSTLRERRVLVASALVATASGPVISALNAVSAGPFSRSVDLLWGPYVDEAQIDLTCDPDGAADLTKQCQAALAAASHTGFAPTLGNLVPLVLTLIVAYGLLRGRRGAWVFAVVLELGYIGGVLQSLDRIEDLGGQDFLGGINLLLVILPWVAMIAVLAFTYRSFTREITGRGKWFGIIGATFLATAVLWMAAFVSSRSGSVWASLREIPNVYLPAALAETSTFSFVPKNSFVWFLYEWIGILFWMVVCYAAFRLYQSETPEAQRADHARTVMEHGTGDHIAFMGLWDGNRYWFAPNDAGYVAYRVERSVAVTIGEPVVAAGQDQDDIADGFEKYCLDNGLRVAWYTVGDGFSRRRQASGFNRLLVAEEAVLGTDDATIAFKGKKFQNVRTARNHAKKQGITAQWTTWDEVGFTMHEQIYSLSEEWMDAKALPEMGFTLGTVDELSVEGTRLLLAVGEDGALHGITSWLPVYKDGRIDGYTLDVMRRSPSGFRHSIEFLLAEALVVGHDQGVNFMSLSGAPLSGNPKERTALDDFMSKLGAVMEPLYGFRSLAFSKTKFDPGHDDWYLCYNDEFALGAIGVAISRCYLPKWELKDTRQAFATLCAAHKEERERERAAAEKAAAQVATEKAQASFKS